MVKFQPGEKNMHERYRGERKRRPAKSVQNVYVRHLKCFDKR